MLECSLQLVLVPFLLATNCTAAVLEFAIQYLAGKTFFRHPCDMADPSKLASDYHAFNAGGVRILEDSHMRDAVSPSVPKNTLQAADVESL